MMPALAFALQALQVLPGLVSAGVDIAHLVNQTTTALGKMQAEKRDPTQEEWDALNEQIAGLRKELHS